MTGRRVKLLLVRVVVFSALALLAAISVSVVAVRRNAEASVDTRQIESITRHGRTLTFVKCPECENRLSVASDGMSATINLCRLGDGNPDAREFARRRDAMIEWAFLIMEEKARVSGKGED